MISLPIRNARHDVSAENVIGMREKPDIAEVERASKAVAVGEIAKRPFAVGRAMTVAGSDVPPITPDLHDIVWLDGLADNDDLPLSHAGKNGFEGLQRPRTVLNDLKGAHDIERTFRHRRAGKRVIAGKAVAIGAHALCKSSRSRTKIENLGILEDIKSHQPFGGLGLWSGGGVVGVNQDIVVVIYGSSEILRGPAIEKGCEDTLTDAAAIIVHRDSREAVSIRLGVTEFVEINDIEGARLVAAELTSWLWNNKRASKHAYSLARTPTESTNEVHPPPFAQGRA